MTEQARIYESVSRMVRANENKKVDDGGRAVTAALRQSVCSLQFLITVLAAVVVLVIGVFTDLLSAFQSEALLDASFHFSILNKAVRSDAFAFALPILSTVPFSSAFLEELKHGFIKEYLPRTTRFGYLMGKILGCMVSGGAGLAGGMGMALGISWLIFSPVEKAVGAKESHISSMEMFVQDLLLVFLIGAFWALVGMLMSLVTNSKYMAYTAPFIFYYVLIILCERYFRSCYVLHPGKWLSPESFPGGAGGILLFLGELSFLLILIFVNIAGKRIQSL